MPLIYSRLNAGEHGRLGVGLLGRNAADSKAERDLWDEFCAVVPAPAKWQYPAPENSRSYVLHKEPGGAWLIDRWMAESAGTMCAAADAAPAPAAGQEGICFIIDMCCASR